ncbi:MAG: radical SAM family heme chaperone HemW [Sedimentibacter saalensis]|uniref:radical SAM family heme chaperone HemW n=1 Tax=Sedimentibacter saalensis TaxID=130788 RepID=UPI002B20E41C|nr:radical SAM family heme chaperone HemW [Sedimentibacter saalensis]MEA5095483.1 radical SAM family heme chaperone HemW [Sedimentibacter saalensis]
MKKLGVYIHVPFCKKKCNYCDFYSVKWNDEWETKYTEAVIDEIKSYKEMLGHKYIVDTVYFGGGTPTIIKPSNLKSILDSISIVADIDTKAEISMEANPNTLTDENLKQYRETGINRLSIGIQSLNDGILKKIWRIHNSKEALEAIDRARKHGFENINADAMFNIPVQTTSDIEDTLSKIIERGVKHISFYSLKLEKGTPLYSMEQKNLITMPDEDEERNMYYKGRFVMEKSNLFQYEISNFAAEGFQCRHNLKYWNQEEYIGIGPSAHSFMNSIRYSNPSDLNLYCKNSIENNFNRIIQEEMNKEELMFEYIMLRLRLTEGLDANEFKRKFNVDFNEKYKVQIKYLTDNKLIENNESILRLTQRGMDISNYVFEEFME